MQTNQAVYEINELALDNDALLLNETIFHNANGYIGIRGNFEEGYPEGFNSIRGQYINGFYDFAQMNQAEKLCGLVEEKQTMLNLVDTQSIQLSIDNEVFSLFEGKVLTSKRWLDMDKGITGRRITWCSPSGKEVDITILRMTSFYQMSLFTIDYQVTALNFTGTIKLISTHDGGVSNYCNPDDPRVAGESIKHLFHVKTAAMDDETYITSHTSKSDLYVCTGVKHVFCQEDSKQTTVIEDEKGICTVEANIRLGETLRFIKYTVFADSIRHADYESQAKEEMKNALSLSLSNLYEKQEEYLKNYWNRCSVSIEGDDDLNIALRYNLYQLLQSVGKDQYSNVAAKGLSGEGYEGHFFWDTEMYMQPFFTLTQPEIAKNLIEYRYNILDAARENAAILGHEKGALFPWRTIMGKECSGYFPSGSAQYHINGDVSYSVVAYYLATKDVDFIVQKGGEILFETARLWIDTGNFTKGKFMINEVTGPDEYTCLVNNNYYTNTLAQYNLKWAAKFYDMLVEKGETKTFDKIGLTIEEVDEFRKAAKLMYLPYDEEMGINPQDDSFLQKKVWDIANTPKDKFPLLLHYHPMYLYRYQVCKQADTVLAHFILEDAQSLETIEKSFAYYETVTTHDSSLSTCIFSIVASKLGLDDKAYEYFGDSAKLDLFNTHHNTKDGIHTANMGGNYMAIVYGFGGLRVKEEGIFFAPRLPKQWKGYEFKTAYEDSIIKVEIKDNLCTFTLEEGKEKEIHVYGKKLVLKDKLTVDRI